MIDTFNFELTYSKPTFFYAMPSFHNLLVISWFVATTFCDRDTVYRVIFVLLHLQTVLPHFKFAK